MNRHLAPEYTRSIAGVKILWFKIANKYLILDDENFILVNCFLNSENSAQFNNLINLNLPSSMEESNVIYNELETLLTALNKSEDDKLDLTSSSKFHLNKKKAYLTNYYFFNGISFEVNYDSNDIQNLIHPQFAHLEINEPEIKSNCVFHIIFLKGYIHFFKNKNHLGSYKGIEYNLLQGKFAIELLCLITNTNESEWLATFHASAIANNKEAIMLIGDSGKGKSTLATVLMDSGFYLLSDDFTPMLAYTQNIFPYPAAISIKKKAFDVLETLSDKITYKTFQSPNINKGLIRYVAPLNPKFDSLPCHKIILVNYKQNSKTVLEKIDIKKALNILIPESWISPIPSHVEIFLNWLEQCVFYELSYSDNTEAVAVLKTILKPTN